MTAYTHSLTIRVPASLYDTACAIARSMDPDTGGADSFGPRTRREGLNGPEVTPDHYETVTPCTEEFHAQAHAMLHDAALLHAVVTADYAKRWPDLTAPTLTECEAFVAGAAIEVPPEPELLA